MAQLEVHLLGPLQVLLDGRPVSFESARVRALMAVLAAEAPRPQFRESLAGLLWPDWPQQSAMNNLRYALANLRKNTGDREARPPYFIINRETIQLDLTSEVRVDTVEFLRTGEVGLYRGPFLEGLRLPDSPEFSEWQEAKRAYYQQQVLEQLGKQAAACEQSGAYEQGLVHARRELAIEPWLEEAHRQVMRLLALRGERSAALAQYEVCKRMLEKELHATPGEETRNLCECIRAGEWPGVKTQPEPVRPGYITEVQPKHNLPAQLTQFIGRQKEIDALRELLAGGNARLVTLTGSGGCGKTRLALQVAEVMVDVFNDGVWLVELAPLTDPQKIDLAVAAALGLQIEGSQSLLDGLTTYLKKRQLLLVFDNCEHMLESSARLINHLLRSCPGLRVLVTSREGLGVTGEVSYRVPSLSIPTEQTGLDAGSVLRSEAGSLFYDRASRVLPGFALTAHSAQTVAQICQQLDGIPLAIELAAARASGLGLEEIAARLKDSFRLLVEGSRAALPRQQTLRASIDWSYNILSENERLLLRRLSVFSGGCTLGAAEAVCGGDGIAPEEVFDLLDSLVRKSLVVFSGEGSSQSPKPRYRLLETIRQYAREKLLDGEEGTEIRRGHLLYFTELVEQAEEEHVGLSQLYWLRLMDQEMGNIRAAMDWCLDDPQDGSFQAGLRLLSAMRNGICNYDPNEATGWVEALVADQERMAATPLKLRARFLLAQARFLSVQGLFVAALPVARESLRLLKECGDAGLIVDAIVDIAMIEDGMAVLTGQHFEEYIIQAEVIAEQAGIAQEKWKLLQYLKAEYYSEKDTEKAKQAFQDLLNYSKKTENLLWMAGCLRLLGFLALYDGQNELAQEYAKKCTVLHQELNNLRACRIDMYLCGDCAHALGKYDQMEIYFREASLLSDRTGFRPGRVWSDHHIGVAARRKGDLRRAARLTCQSLDRAAEYEMSSSLLEGVCSLGGLAADLGHWRESALLLGVVQSLRSTYLIGPVVRTELAQDLPVVKSALGDEAFEQAMREGSTLTLEEAVAFGRALVERCLSD